MYGTTPAVLNANKSVTGTITSHYLRWEISAKAKRCTALFILRTEM